MLVKLQYNHLHNHICKEWQSFYKRFFISILQMQISGMVTYDRNNEWSNIRKYNAVHLSFILTPD